MLEWLFIGFVGVCVFTPLDDILIALGIGAAIDGTGRKFACYPVCRD